MRIKNDDLRAGLAGLKIMRDQARPLVRSWRTAKWVGRYRNHHQATIFHRFQLTAQQKRLFDNDGIEFDLPVVAIYNADDTLRGKIFADINSKQERVSDMHLLSLYYQIKELPADDSSVMDVLNQLNTDTDSHDGLR